MSTTTVIFGPPGTGKTRTLLKIITELYPEFGDSMAVVSFSRSAAQELTTRLKNTPAYVGTLHALCFKVLDLSKPQVATTKQFASYIIGDPIEVDSAIAIGSLSRALKITYEEAYWKHKSDISYSLCDFYWRSYNSWKDTRYLTDFDDMLEQAKGKIGPYAIVIVDEAQDMTRTQWDLIKSMVAKNGQLICAGDDDQSIYTWNGAYPYGMLELGGKTKTLTQSYRVPRTVHLVAEATIKQIYRRHKKKYRPTAEEGYFNYAETYLPIALPSHTVLCRDHWRIKDIEEILQQYSMPYRLEGVHGRGLLYGKWGQLARAIVEGKETYLHQRARDLTPYALTFLNKGEMPPPDQWRRCLLTDNVKDILYLEKVGIHTEARVIVSTIHAQKGKEFDHVVIISDLPASVEVGSNKGEEFDNEVRVWYTALTRAKKGVTLIGNNQFIKS